MKISGNIVDILNKKIFPGTIETSGQKIVSIKKDNKKYNRFIMPGFIDSHVHIESSMLPPSEFARLAVVHGTIDAVSDPHEIANVLGLNGIKYMINNGKNSGFRFYFGAPSCVPSTVFETSGAKIGAKQIEKLLKNKNIKYLSEMMNFPGVINNDKEVIAKIALAKKYKKLIDGHAPGLKGKNMEKYFSKGISTDHECFEFREAVEKIKQGVKIQIREGSAAKNFGALAPLIKKYPENCMLCSDDKHPDDLVKGHINEIVKMAVKKGIGKFDVLRCACINPVIHYGLDIGLLREKDYADFIVVNNLKKLDILKVFIKGKLVAKNGRSLIKKTSPKKINKFKAKKKKVSDFAFKNKNKKINAIQAIDGQLITKKIKVNTKNAVPDIKRDVLKIAVINRYKNKKPAVGFVKGFGLKKGAIASSVAHDCHNIICVGTNDKDICRAVNKIIGDKGGLCAVSGGHEYILKLPIAGLMSDKKGYEVAKKYREIDRLAKNLGSKLNAPFMALSFMALPVIPSIKITDKGLFDVDRFRFI